MQPRHFIDICDLTAADLRALLAAAADFKAGWAKGERARQREILDGQALAMIFEKPSTRTRVSFDLAMRQLGGETLVLTAGELQLGRGETIADTARVLSRYADIIMIRTGSHAKVQELAAHAEIPVINGLSERSHPCQVVADLMTFEEHVGKIDGQSIAWVGDGNNVALSWVQAAGVLGFNIRIATPQGFSPDPETVAWARKQGAAVELTNDPAAAVKGAACVVTDTWVSMSDEDAKRRKEVFRPYQVTAELMAEAAKDAIFMHCLPAHRGDEVAAEVIDGPQSVVWDEAENRLHSQKAILAWCLGKAGL